VPVAKRAEATVPEEIFDAFKDVMFAPLNVAVDDPVPPRATAKVPEETASALSDVMFAPLNVAVVDPVPPEATGSAVASVREVKCVMASVTIVPLLYTYIVLPAGTAIPVPVEFLTVTV
jgi:hypothetical protein